MTTQLKQYTRATGSVGYANAPTVTRFKRGESGNPRGRPKAPKATRFIDLIFAELDRPIRLKDGEIITRLEAIVRKQFALAIGGDVSASRNLVPQILATDPPAEMPPLPNEDRDAAKEGTFAEIARWLDLRYSNWQHPPNTGAEDDDR